MKKKGLFSMMLVIFLLSFSTFCHAQEVSSAKGQQMKEVYIIHSSGAGKSTANLIMLQADKKKSVISTDCIAFQVIRGDAEDLIYYVTSNGITKYDFQTAAYEKVLNEQPISSSTISKDNATGTYYADLYNENNMTHTIVELFTGKKVFAYTDKSISCLATLKGIYNNNIYYELNNDFASSPSWSLNSYNISTKSAAEIINLEQYKKAVGFDSSSEIKRVDCSVRDGYAALSFYIVGTPTSPESINRFEEYSYFNYSRIMDLRTKQLYPVPDTPACSMQLLNSTDNILYYTLSPSLNYTAHPSDAVCFPGCYLYAFDKTTGKECLNYSTTVGKKYSTAATIFNQAFVLIGEDDDYIYVHAGGINPDTNRITNFFETDTYRMSSNQLYKIKKGTAKVIPASTSDIPKAFVSSNSTYTWGINDAGFFLKHDLYQNINVNSGNVLSRKDLPGSKENVYTYDNPSQYLYAIDGGIYGFDWARIRY